MSTEYNEEKFLTEFVDKVIRNEGLTELAALRQNVKLLCCVSCRQTKTGETEAPRTEPVALKKVSDALRIFIKDKARYVIVADYAWWEGANEKQRYGEVLNVLNGIEVKTNNDGSVKLNIITPPAIHPRTITRMGAYNAHSAAMLEAFNSRDGRLSLELMAVTVTKHALAAQVASQPQQTEEEEEAPHVRTQQEVEAEMNDKASENDAIEAEEPNLPIPKLPKGVGKNR